MRRPAAAALTVASLAGAACAAEPERLEALDVDGRVYDFDTGLGIAGVSVAIHVPGGPVGRSGLASADTDVEGAYHMRVVFEGDGILCEPGWLDLGVSLPDGYIFATTGPAFEPLRCTAQPQTRDLALARREGS